MRQSPGKVWLINRSTGNLCCRLGSWYQIWCHHGWTLSTLSILIGHGGLMRSNVGWGRGGKWGRCLNWENVVVNRRGEGGRGLGRRGERERDLGRRGKSGRCLAPGREIGNLSRGGGSVTRRRLRWGRGSGRVIRLLASE